MTPGLGGLAIVSSSGAFASICGSSTGFCSDLPNGEAGKFYESL